MIRNERCTLSLKNDLIFKAVFGRDTEECKFVLMALLNRILGREEDPIVKLEYKNPFIIGEYKEEKGSVLDIKVTTDSGELIDIEMQVYAHEYLRNRLVYYHGGLIRGSLKKGDDYGKMSKTITICIVDEVVFPGTDGYLNRFFLMEEKSHARFTDATEICLIELPKVNREGKPAKELTPLELCLEYIKYANEEGSEYADSLVRHGGKELKMAQHILEKVTEEERLREKALAREKYLRDEISRQESIKKHDQLKREVAQGQKELSEGQKALSRGRRELAQGKKELFQGQQELAQGQQELAQGQQELAQGQQELAQGQQELDQRQQELAQGQQELAQGQQELIQREQDLTQREQAVAQGQQQLKHLEKRYQVKELDLARRLLADGIPVEKVMEYTGLTKQMIQTL